MPASSQTLYITPVETESGWVFNSDGVYPEPPSGFTPLLAEDFSGGSVGVGYSGFESSSIYANDQPTLSGQSLKIQLAAATPPVCGGSPLYGGRKNLPEDIPVGKSIWVKMRRYIPATHTWSYIYNSGDAAAAAACDGVNGAWAVSDGGEWLKDIVLAPSVGTARIYVQPAQSRRSDTHPDGMRVIAEASQDPDDNESATFPTGQWFSTQIYVRVDNTGAGIMRVWIDETLVCEKIAQNISSAENVLREWGIGNYCNGVPYVDGVSMTSHYWVKDVIMASDIDGYGAPTTTDSSGNVYIDPELTPEDFE